MRVVAIEAEQAALLGRHDSGRSREIVLRVPPQLAARPAPMSRVGFWLHLPEQDLDYVRSLSIAEVPALCSAPPRL